MDKQLNEIAKIIASTKEEKKLITFLTGAGISAESGIPTYRGHDGIWIKGTQYHQPKEIATFDFFKKDPIAFWDYTLQRRKLFSDKKPNAGHEALVDIEVKLGGFFRLITQNVDELHRKAGNTEGNMCEIHGKSSTMRCSDECSEEIYPLPQIGNLEDELEKIKCPICGEFTRPNILLFDESYDERLYKLDTSLTIAFHTGILFTIGTTGETYLPNVLVDKAMRREAILVDINIEDNYFAGLAQKNNGYVLRGKSSEILRDLNELL